LATSGFREDIISNIYTGRPMTMALMR